MSSDETPSHKTNDQDVQQVPVSVPVRARVATTARPLAHVVDADLTPGHVALRAVQEADALYIPRAVQLTLRVARHVTQVHAYWLYVRQHRGWLVAGSLAAAFLIAALLPQTPAVVSAVALQGTSPWQAVAFTYAMGGGAGPGVNVPKNAGGNAPNKKTSPPPSRSSWHPTDPWAYVQPAYQAHEPWPDSMAGAWGYCTWWANHTFHRNLIGMGDAWRWTHSARERSYPTGSHARAGATVIFAPGVEGAGGLGHVAHVEQVYGDSGWFLVSEMNFYWNGGGWARVSFRYAYEGWGVRFIY